MLENLKLMWRQEEGVVKPCWALDLSALLKEVNLEPKALPYLLDCLPLPTSVKVSLLPFITFTFNVLYFKMSWLCIGQELVFKQFSLGLKREFILNGRKHFKRCFGRERFWLKMKQLVPVAHNFLSWFLLHKPYWSLPQDHASLSFPIGFCG